MCIPYEKRFNLIKMVEGGGITIKETAKRLGINYCTAKHILKVYRDSGSIESLLHWKRKLNARSLMRLENLIRMSGNGKLL